ncbi:type II toxin-antitoxin system PemK/MazF family toxin [Clostridium sp.]|jgi:mRNA interferase MazF|uniref:type II toxin-antitoxin system PemK/MazF family toxin n=1 Tax=Clostridium sp. TaxID=1506 RepID=UPI0025BCC9AA|nr:type II toxin-antitoxin system PemK/MazF family toxin [Clostridium sp.]MCI9069105.1 type II toxin-antitoxin system PemK/MazF family toxin [Clostridium sp.]
MEIYRDSIIMMDFGQNQGCVQSGRRPAVVIQNDVGNKFSTTTIVVSITGKNKKDYTCLKCDSTILAE